MNTYAHGTWTCVGLVMIDLPLLRYLAEQLITSRLKLLQLPLPVLCSDQWSLVSCTLLVLMLVSLKVIKQVPVLLRHHQSRYALCGTLSQDS